MSEEKNLSGENIEEVVTRPEVFRRRVPKLLLHKVAPAFITVLIFFLIFRQVKISTVVNLLEQVPLSYWLMAFSLTMILLVITAMRWQTILRSMGFSIPLKRSFLIILGIWPLGALTPSKAGDLFRAMSLRREINPVIVAGSVLAERVVDLFLLSAFAFIGGWIFQRPNICLIAGLMILLLCTVVFLANIKIKAWERYGWYRNIENLSQSMRMLKAQPVLLFNVFFLTLVKWFIVFLETKIFFSGVGGSVSYQVILTVLPVCIFVGLLPITIGGMGTRDSAMVLLFAEVATAPQALAVGFLYSFFGYWLLAFLGVFFTKKALDW